MNDESKPFASLQTICSHCKTSQNVVDGKFEEHARWRGGVFTTCLGSNQPAQPEESTPFSRLAHALMHTPTLPEPPLDDVIQQHSLPLTEGQRLAAASVLADEAKHAQPADTITPDTDALYERAKECKGTIDAVLIEEMLWNLAREKERQLTCTLAREKELREALKQIHSAAMRGSEIRSIARAALTKLTP